MQEHLINLIRINTSNPPGNEMAAAVYIKEALEKEGIEAEVLESAPNRGNMVCRLKGDGSKKPLLIAGHIDVVDVVEEEWSVPAFEGLKKDGFIWGRGSLDMKFTIAKYLVLVMELKRRNFPLKRDIIFAATADEEQNSFYGMHWMCENHFDRIEAEYSLNEGGGYCISLNGKNMYNCQTAEKGSAWYKLVTKGEPGHGSVPKADNPILRMSRAIEKISKPMPQKRIPIVQEIISGLSKRMLGGAKGLVLSQVLNPVLGKPVAKLISKVDSDIGDMIYALSHDTVSATIINAGDKENVIPDRCEAMIDVRLLPGQTAAAFREFLLKTLDIDEVELVREGCPDPTESPADTELFRAVEKAVMSNDPDAVVLPLLMPAATDSRFLRQKGVIAYGFSPLRSKVPVQEFLPTIHGHDERIPYDDFEFTVKVFYDLLTDFCG